MRARLAESEAVSEARAAEDEGRARARDIEARTLQQVPAERATDDDLEVPAAQDATALAREFDEFGAARLVVSDDAHGVESCAHVASLVRAKRSEKLRRR